MRTIDIQGVIPIRQRFVLNSSISQWKRFTHLHLIQSQSHQWQHHSYLVALSLLWRPLCLFRFPASQSKEFLFLCVSEIGCCWSQVAVCSASVSLPAEQFEFWSSYTTFLSSDAAVGWCFQWVVTLDSNMIILDLLLKKFQFSMTYWCKLAKRLGDCRVVPSIVVRGKLLTIY